MKKWIGLAVAALVSVGCAPKSDHKDSGVDSGLTGDSGDTDDTGDSGDTNSLTTATLSGVITRTAALTGDGEGLAAVWVYTVDPDKVAGRVEPDNPQPLPANFTDADTEIAFTIENLPPQKEPFWVLAIFDDDGSGWQLGPGTGDLLALDGRSLFQVVMDVPGQFELNLVLNTVQSATD